MSKHAWDVTYWMICWIGLGFFVAEILGWAGIAPWGTLTSTIRWEDAVVPLFGVFIMGVCIFLPTHLLFGRPVWQSLAFGLAVSVLAHLLDKHWP